MSKIATVEQTRRIEAAADAAGFSYADMMENAGRATAQRALAVLAQFPDARVTVLVGKGNNGGDGLVAARVLAESGKALVRCYLLHQRDGDPLLESARQAGAHIANADDDQGFRVLRQMVGSAHLLIDALFGIGVQLPLRDPAARLLQQVNNGIADVRSLKPEARLISPADPACHPRPLAVPYVLAVDCPSGLDCDTGEIDRSAIPADETVTYIAAKPGLFIFPGAAHVGRLTVATIGIPENLPQFRSITTTLADAEWAFDHLPPRPVNSHKGTYGKALIIAGSDNYRGAPALSARAAYHIGAGLVSVSAPPSVIDTIAGHILEATWLLPGDDLAPADFDALLIGPGWGRANGDLLSRLLAQPLPRLVIDADGLNLLAETPDWWKQLPPNTILTPHPGEMARLSRLPTADIQSDRMALALQKAAEWHVILLLKGAHTIIAAPDSRAVLLPFKTDALAKAGSGDVLAGVIVGLLAQGADPFTAAALAGYVHALAGELAAHTLGTTRSVLASDVSAHLAQALMRIERRSWTQS